MTKRIKRVFSNGKQVLHLWANQSQDSARSSNVFFSGKDCYSYGYHYKLGSIMTFKGVKLAMINNSGYSVTTSKHISWASSAVSHLPMLYTQHDFDVIKSLKDTKASLESRMKDHFKKVKLDKTDYWNREYNSLRDSIKEFNKTCDILKSKKYKVKVTSKYIRDYDAHVNKRIKRQEELNTPEMLAKRSAESIRRAELKAERLRVVKEEVRKKELESIEAWKSGSGHATNAVNRIYPRIIRVKGDNVETSGGATVPLSEARLLLSRIMRSEAKQGELIGGFTFDSVKNNIVKIGCHDIDLEQAKSVLNTLTLVKVG